MSRVVVDVDGVLAEFNEPFRKLLIDQGANVRPFDPRYDPDRWEWPLAYGAEKKHDIAAWEYIGDHPEWWGRLPIHRDVNNWAMSQLDRVLYNYETSFVTQRPGNRATTLEWLQKLSIDPDFVPQLLMVPGGKVEVLRAMQPHYVIEDKHETLRKLSDIQMGKGEFRSRKLILVDRPYNRGFDNTGLVVVGSTEEALRVIP